MTMACHDCKVEREAALEAIGLKRDEAAKVFTAAEMRNQALDAQAGQLEEATAQVAALERHLDERGRLIDASEAVAATHNAREQVQPSPPSLLLFSCFMVTVRSP